MSDTLTVNQFFARADALLGKEVELEGYAVIPIGHREAIYLVEGVQAEGELFEKKILLASLEPREESSKPRSFEKYWDDLLRDGKTDIATFLALSHYHTVLREKSYQSLEFFIKTKTMDFLDEFTNEFTISQNKYQKLSRLLSYAKRKQLENYNIFTHKIIITGFLTETPRSEKDAQFLTWTSAKLYREDSIIYIGKTLRDISMRIEKVTKFADIQDSPIVDFGYLRLEAILGGHYSRAENQQFLYLLPHMLFIHVDKLPRGVRIASEAFYEDVLPACPPMRSPITHAYPIHLTGKLSKLNNPPYSHEISDIQEVAVLNNVGIWHIPIGVWRFDF